jgi:ribulose-phosphate 3-epimerase
MTNRSDGRRREAAWQPQIAASILTADFGHLDRTIRKLERAGVDRLHLDVMDGHFVPNLTFGPDIVAACRRLTTLPIDVHLMVTNPRLLLDRFLDANPQTVTFHVEVPETDADKEAALSEIRDAGAGAGLAVSPATPVAAVERFIERLDLVMVMTVEPGFGGQRFLADSAPKLTEAGRLFERHGMRGSLHVDGGVNRDTASVVGAWGADICVVGSALFQRGRDASDEVRTVRERAAEGRRMGPPADEFDVVAATAGRVALG